MKIIERLEILRKLNRDPNWVNDNIFRLVCSPQLAVLAYERIKSKAGNMTAGEDKVTLDEISMQAIEDMCASIKDGSYNPRPVRRKFIPKANGKMRPLGIPSPRDKIVQDMVREILEAIYDSAEHPTFSEHSHGFRPRRSVHTAIREYTTWQGTKWLIEGDIVGFFDNIDHHILVSLLRKRISDERFINLVWKFLRAGIREDDGSLSASLKGTPQGGIISPILANIYLHEFDNWVARLQERLTKGTKRKPNPEWRRLTRRRQRLLDLGQASPESEEIKQLEQQARSMPTVLTDDPDFCRVYYTRYADDWVIGVASSRQVAASIKEEATAFLADTLKLELSPEKTLISNAKEGDSKFLSFRLSVGDEVRRTTVRTTDKRTVVKRTTGWLPRVDVPVPAVMSRLQKAGFCRSGKGKLFFPCSKKSFVTLEDHEIVMRFNSVWRGLYNYYSICNNAWQMRWIMYVLQYSCLMTLSHKHRRRVPQTISKLGVFPCVAYKLHDGSSAAVQFWRPLKWRTDHAPRCELSDIDVLIGQTRRLTRTSINRPCAVCSSELHVEMHHVRALRKGNKSITRGFNRVMSAINRKQIPLCRVCHRDVHAGRYDGISLSDLAYVPQ